MPSAMEFLGFSAGRFRRVPQVGQSAPLLGGRSPTAPRMRTSAGFDPSYRYVVDWDFWYRVSCKYAVSWKLHDATVLVRWHAGQRDPPLQDRDRRPGGDRAASGRHLTSRSGRGCLPGKAGGPRIDRLSRAFLNRSHEALRNGQTDLARDCLRRAWGLSSSGAIKTLGTDPRLCAQMSDPGDHAPLGAAGGLAGIISGSQPSTRASSHLFASRESCHVITKRRRFGPWSGFRRGSASSCSRWRRHVPARAGDPAGQVVDQEGKGVPGATVWAIGRKLGRARVSPPRATTDDSGRFALPGAWKLGDLKLMYVGLFARAADGRCGWVATVWRNQPGIA